MREEQASFKNRQASRTGKLQEQTSFKNSHACPFVRIAVGCDLKDRWRSWLARLHDTEEVTGSSPVRFILFFAFNPPFQSCERGMYAGGCVSE